MQHQSEQQEAQSSRKIAQLQKRIHDLEIQLGLDQQDSEAAVGAWEQRLKKLQSETGVKIQTQDHELVSLRTKLHRMETDYDALLQQVV